MKITGQSDSARSYFASRLNLAGIPRGCVVTDKGSWSRRKTHQLRHVFVRRARKIRRTFCIFKAGEVCFERSTN